MDWHVQENAAANQPVIRSIHIETNVVCCLSFRLMMNT